MQTNTEGYKPDLMPLKPFFRANQIPLSSGYRYIARGEIRVVKLGGRSYVDLPHWREQLKKLPLADVRPAKAA